MTIQREFLVAENSYVRINMDGNIDLDFAPFHASVDGKILFEATQEEILNAGFVSIGNFSPEQAYLIGKALLVAAKAQGISE